jgi:hypothetical protein
MKPVSCCKIAAGRRSHRHRKGRNKLEILWCFLRFEVNVSWVFQEYGAKIAGSPWCSVIGLQTVIPT